MSFWIERGGLGRYALGDLFIWNVNTIYPIVYLAILELHPFVSLVSVFISERVNKFSGWNVKYND